MDERLLIVLPWLAINTVAAFLACTEWIASRDVLEYARRTSVRVDLLVLSEDMYQQAFRRFGTAIIFTIIGLATLLLPPPVAGWALTVGLFVVDLWLLWNVAGSRQARLKIERDLKESKE